MIRVLIDTQAIIWYSHTDTALSTRARAIIDEPATICFVSIATIWEMAIKIAKSKLDLGINATGVAALNQFIDLLASNDIELLPISTADAIAVASLPSVDGHKDPFDRLIAAQCLNHDLTLISIDRAFDLYGVRRVWA